MFTKIVESIYGKTLALFLAFVVLFSSHASASNGGNIVVLKSGTAVNLELMSTINANKVKTGEIVDFRVLNDVKVDGNVVIPAGSIAKGQIVSAEKNGLLGGAGELSLTVRSVVATDGTTVPLTASSLNDEGQDKLVISMVLTLLCVLGFLIKGGKAEIVQGAQLTATVLSNTEISIN